MTDGNENFENVANESEIIDEIEEEIVTEPELKIIVTDNKTEVSLVAFVTNREQVIKEEAVLSLLEENGIVYGIKNKEIKKYCESRNYGGRFLCAEGLMPIDQEDAQIKYYFEREVELCPQDREDGTVDYYDLGLIQQVKAGDVLCEIQPAPPGTDGINVYGEAIPFLPGRIPPLPAGNNTVISEDGLFLTSKIDGMIVYRNATVTVNDVCDISGDVDNTTGNIIFSGSVIVHGDVRTGFKIESGKDVMVSGVVEGATIKAEGDIKISSGVIGINKAELIAKGDITAKYFENATVKSDSNVYADVFMNSTVIAGKNICADGQKASMIGGSYTAGKVICAGFIGSDNGVSTLVTIASQELMNIYNNSLGDHYQNLIKIKEEKNSILNQIFEKSKSLNSADPNDKATYDMLILARKQTEEQIAELDNEKTKLMPFENIIKYRIIAKKYLYQGVKITIGPFTERVVIAESHMRYYMGDNQINKTIASQSDYIGRG